MSERKDADEKVRGETSDMGTKSLLKAMCPARSARRRHRSPDERRPLGAAGPPAPDHPGAGLQPAAGALRRLRGRRGGAEG